MDIKVNIEEHDFRREMQSAIEKAIQEHIEPKVAEYLKNTVNSEAVAHIIESRIKDSLSYSVYNGGEMRGIDALFHDRVVEIAKRVTDQDLKDFLMETVFQKIKGK